jgi:hypothetical protein
MYILNITYVVAENKVAQWKNWLKTEAFSKSIAFQHPSFQLYKINHVAEEGQVSLKTSPWSIYLKNSSMPFTQKVWGPYSDPNVCFSKRCSLEKRFRFFRNRYRHAIP